jgi:hypothetical protein
LSLSKDKPSKKYTQSDRRYGFDKLTTSGFFLPLTLSPDVLGNGLKAKETIFDKNLKN